MALWKQLAVVLALVAGTAAAWALFVPSAAPVLARLGLPVREAPPRPTSTARGPGGGAPGAVLVTGAPVGDGLANARVSAIGDGRSLRSVAVTPLDGGRLVALEVAAGGARSPRAT